MATKVRLMLEPDMQSVLWAEWATFGDPWDEDDFMHAMREPGVIGKVAEVDGEVVGHMVVVFGKTRIELLNLAVHSGHTGKGIGRDLVECLIERLNSRSGCQEIYLHIRERNLDGQLFFRQMGFRALAVERGYFGDEDAYRMVYDRPLSVGVGKGEQ